MKLEQSNTQKLKYQALFWLRIHQRCPFIATEVGSFSADVLGINEKNVVEIEVKTSESDLRADFKKPKHHSYNSTFGNGWDQQWMPNKFYYAVTPDLVGKAHEMLTKFKCENYGIISLEGFRVVKRSKLIHDRVPNSHVKLAVALRMGSELIRFHEAWV